MSYAYWLILGMVLLIAEILTPGFVVACFGVGALLAMIPSFFGLGIVWQVLVFCAGSLLSLFLLRPMLVRLSKSKKAVDTGVDALIGRVVMVTKIVEPGSIGRVAIDGDSWQARSVGSDVIAVGSKVRVIAKDSIVLTVELLEQ